MGRPGPLHFPFAIQRIQTDNGSSFGPQFTWHLSDPRISHKPEANGKGRSNKATRPTPRSFTREGISNIKEIGLKTQEMGNRVQRGSTLLALKERLTCDGDTLRWEVTADDPKVLTKSWVMTPQVTMLTGDPVPFWD
jgi:hypothetical protein